VPVTSIGVDRDAAASTSTGRPTRSLARGACVRIDVVTLFPEMVEHAARFGITGRARERGLWRLGCGIRATSRPTTIAPSTTARTAADRGW
jgi:hypothetical protein